MPKTTSNFMVFHSITYNSKLFATEPTHASCLFNKLKQIHFKSGGRGVCLYHMLKIKNSELT